MNNAPNSARDPRAHRIRRSGTRTAATALTALLLAPALAIAPATASLAIDDGGGGGGGDTEPPSISLTTDPALAQGWAASPVTVSMRSYDTHPSTATYTITGPESSSGTVPIRSTQATRNVTLTTPGVYTVTVTAQDVAENLAERVLEIKVDGDLPSIGLDGALSSGQAVLGQSTPALFSCADASGIVECFGVTNPGGQTIQPGGALPTMATGDYTLAITAVDRVGHRHTVIAPFTVAGVFSATQTPSLSNAELRVGVPITANGIDWSPAPDVVEYRLLAGDGAVTGWQSSTAFVIPPAAAGTSLAVEVRAIKAGFHTASRTSTPSNVPVAYGVFTVADPGVVIDGIPEVGRTVTASVGAITPEVTHSRVWRWYDADTGELLAAGNSAYTVQTSDAGRRLLAEVRLEGAGMQPAGFHSQPTERIPDVEQPLLDSMVVPKAKALSDHRVRIEARVKIDRQQSADAAPVPTGRVEIVRKGKVVAKAKLGGKGGFDVLLKKQHVGRQQYSVRYLGDATTAPSRATVTVKVRR